MHTFAKYSTLMLLLILQFPAHASSQDQLFSLIDARLELMDEVAAYKWQNELAIEDVAREQLVLDEAADAALNANLDPETSRLFFAAQIEAAKEIQHYWFSQYKKGGQKPDVRDLNEEVRPELLRLGKEILNSMSAQQLLNEDARDSFVQHVNVTGLSPETRDLLFTRLMAVSRFPDALSRILKTGELRVGTTGDYAPFSWKSGEQWQGVDIDMARDLATALGVNLVLVQTSWPSLIADLDLGKFDISMSGISINTERALHGYYSLPYHNDGKTPIARCTDVEQLDSLIEIDQPSVRVIVNPGGTNHLFATDNIKQAELIIFPDNRTVFDEIAEGRADVMMTDAVEVKLITKTNQLLCATMPGQTFTQSQKGYLMQPDIRLKEFVNTWLSQRILNGRYQAYFDAAFE